MLKLRVKNTVFATIAMIGLSTTLPIVASANQTTETLPDNSVQNDDLSKGVYISGDSITFRSLEDVPGFLQRNNVMAPADFSDYFYLASDGNIEIDVSNPSLKTKYNLSDQDLQSLQSLNEDVHFTDNSRLRGFVGLHLKLGKKVRGMSAVVAAGYATGYCAYYLKEFAKGPYGMGAVGAISAAIGGAVGWAVNKGMKSVDAGIHIHGAHASYTVHIPK